MREVIRHEIIAKDGIYITLVEHYRFCNIISSCSMKGRVKNNIHMIPYCKFCNSCPVAAVGIRVTKAKELKRNMKLFSVMGDNQDLNFVVKVIKAVKTVGDTVTIRFDNEVLKNYCISDKVEVLEDTIFR